MQTEAGGGYFWRRVGEGRRLGKYSHIESLHLEFNSTSHLCEGCSPFLGETSRFYQVQTSDPPSRGPHAHDHLRVCGLIHIGGEFSTLQQKKRMTYSQVKGQQLPVKRAVLPLTDTKVPAEESQGLSGTAHPLLTHHPYSVIPSVGGKGKRGGLPRVCQPGSIGESCFGTCKSLQLFHCPVHRRAGLPAPESLMKWL